MSLVVQVNQNKILLPKDSHAQDIFMGEWLNAQTLAIAKVQDDWLFKDYTSDEFDFKVNEYTLKYYRQNKNGG